MALHGSLFGFVSLYYDPTTGYSKVYGGPDKFSVRLEQAKNIVDLEKKDSFLNESIQIAKQKQLDEIKGLELKNHSIVYILIVLLFLFLRKLF